MEGGLALLERGVQRLGDEHRVVLFVGQQHFHFRVFQCGADAQVFVGDLRIALDALAQVALHALHGAHQAAHFVLALHGDLVVELARGDRIGHVRGGLQRPHHLATQQREQRHAEHQRRTKADGKDGPQQVMRLLHDRGIRHHHAQREALLRLADL